jgi:hypothetical protein
VLLKNLLCPVILVIILLGLCVPSQGCSNNTNTISATNIPDTKYISYKMETDDVRLKYLNHPLYSFEYPDYFHLLEVYQVPQLTASSKHSDVLFTIHNTDLPETMLWVRVQEPWIAYYTDANELLNYWVSEDGVVTKDITTKEIGVSGIKAYYYKSFQVSPDKYKLENTVFPYNISHRFVFFDYSGYIWEINMFWFYQYSEPPEVEEYFNHIVETFKILK